MTDRKWFPYIRSESWHKKYANHDEIGSTHVGSVAGMQVTLNVSQSFLPSSLNLKSQIFKFVTHEPIKLVRILQTDMAKREGRRYRV